MSLTGDPPADHLQALEGWGDQMGAIEAPLAYDDADGSGDPTEGDAAIANVCYGTDAVLLAWLPQPTDLQLAWQLVYLGWTPGWGALAVPSDGSDTYAVPAVDLEALEVSGDCSL
jgi:hypothetical protein